MLDCRAPSLACRSAGATTRGVSPTARWNSVRRNPGLSQPGFAAHALHLLGEIAAHPDQFDAERSETQYRQALALAEGLGMRPLIAHCHLGLGHISRRTGTREQAERHIATATTIYRELDMTHWLDQAEAELT